MSGAPVVVYAFDPLADGAVGMLVVSADRAARLVAEHRVELVGEHIHAPLRFVVGSAANVDARDALRRARASLPRPRKVARVEQA
jgi:hypothetical protein